MVKIMRGWRVLCLGRGRTARIGGIILFFILVWHVFSVRDAPKKTSHTRPGVEGMTQLPGMQIAEPAKQVRSSSAPADRQVAAPAEEAIEIEKQLRDRETILRESDNVNPRYHGKTVKDKLQELDLPKPIRNQQFLQQNRIPVLGGILDEGEDDDDDEYRDGADGGNDEGKWNGRNKDYEEKDNANDEQDAENNANEEEDEIANDDFGLEDVGGEKLEKFINKEEKKINKKQKDEDVGGEDEGDAEVEKPVEEKQKDDNNAQEVQDDHEEVKNFMEDDDNFDMKTMERDLARRKLKIREVCAKYNLGPHGAVGGKSTIKHPPTPNYDVFYIDRREKLAWCPIYKAASTSWLHNFLILGGVEDSYIKNTKEQISTLARRVWPPLEYSDAEQAFDTCLKFMIVRHPFERLVSAYRDKLENINIGKEHGVEHFYKKYGRKIVAKYRPAGQGPPALRYSQDMDDPSIPPPQGIEPTFSEFVKYIIATDLVYYADDHWMPYYLYCTPCLVDYDVIAKFETLERDQNYIIMKKHLSGKIKPVWKHMTKGIKTSDTIKKYFATITKADLMNLYEKYKLDFELFDYSVDEYLNYVRDS